MTLYPIAPRCAVAAPAPRDRWGWLLLALWVAACVWLVSGRWGAIHALALPDTDDNLRLLEVRDWIAGQGWFDLRQYRLDPPAGADIHWSRLVDLPLALLSLLGGEAFAATAVPLITLLAAMLLMAQIVRTTVAPDAWPWGPALLLMAGPALGMLAPLRIDHHGWQIVGLLGMTAGLVDPARRRGGIVAGLAIAASLAIGLEMLPFLLLGIALCVAGWLADARERDRLRALLVAASIGAAAGWLLFVPPGARFGRCDALSSAYLAPLLLGSAALFVASFFPRHRWIGAAAAGALAALPLLGATGQCLIDPYRAVDPEARRLWLGIVNEALPLFSQPIEIALATLALPLIGLAGSLLMVRRAEDRRGWAVLSALCLAGIVLTLAQTRTGVAAQVLAVPGAAALGWRGRARLAAHRSLLVRVFGSVLLFLGVSAIVPRLAVAALFGVAETRAEQAAGRANAACLAPAAMRRLDALPRGVALAPLDFTPALLVHSHHAGIAGPYHRNGRAIADLMRAFGSDEARAAAIARGHAVRWVMLCGRPAEGDVYTRRAPHGLYARLAGGHAPGWLEPVPLAGTPWRIWRMRD